MSTIALALSGSNLSGEAPFSCCLRVDGELRTLCSPAGERGDIALLARDLLTDAGIAPADLRELRIDLGPGSYTGLRVAITFARFVQHFGTVTVLACDSLALLSSSAHAPPSGRLRPLLDARRGKFHSAAFVERDGLLHAQQEPRAVPFEEVLASTTAGDLFVVPAAIGDEALAALRAAGGDIHTAKNVTAELLFSERLQLTASESAALEPRYLMGSYAE